MELTNPHFLITPIIKNANDIEKLKKELYKIGIMTKDYKTEGLLLLYNQYNQPIKTEIVRECRSLVIDRITFDIISYSCETPYINKKGIEHMLIDSSETFKPQINHCYEGTYLSIFNHNDKWYVSTRRCLDSNDSIYNPVISETEQQSNKMSHYEMFNDIIKKAGYINFDDFSQKLDPSNSYYFVLIHHNNKHVIDYTSQFGDNYSCICLTSVRDSNMKELDIYENKIDFASYDVNNRTYIFVSEKLESFEEFTTNNNILTNESPKSEGVIIRVWNKDMKKYNLIKLQYTYYQFNQVIGPEKNIFKGLIYLYQNNKLLDYFDQNPNDYQIRKIVNPYDTTRSYDVVGIIDSCFKVFTLELFELFKIICSLKTGKQQNDEVYNCLPKEYRDIIYNIRGIYYAKKSILFEKDKESITTEDITISRLKMSDINKYLKCLPTDTIVNFIRIRKLMLNWVKSEPTNKVISVLGTLSTKCERINIKLCAIFTNKLCPDIMPTDILPSR